MRFIHYGHKSFDKDAFIPVQNKESFNKPIGGLWGSPIDSEYGWKDWCKASSFRECDEGNSFVFSLKPDANIYYIRSVDEAKNLPRAGKIHDLPVGIPNLITGEAPCMIMGVDFEAMVKDGIDAILYEQSACMQLYWTLYGWDCDSILVMNPDVILPEQITL